MINPYTQFNTLLKGKFHRVIDPNTKLVAYEDHISLRYYATDIICAYPTYYEIYTGGHLTTSTKHRINKYQKNIYIHKYKGKWYVVDRINMIPCFEFIDGMRIDVA
jgi:hypothetical protein